MEENRYDEYNNGGNNVSGTIGSDNEYNPSVAPNEVNGATKQEYNESSDTSSYNNNYNDSYGNNSSNDYNGSNNYNSSDYNNNDYSSNNYNSSNYNNSGNYNNNGNYNGGYNNFTNNSQPPKKNNNSVKKKIAIAGCVVAGIGVIAFSGMFLKSFADYANQYAANNGSNEIAWEKDKESDNKEETNEPTSTTAPVSVSTGSGEIGAVTDVSGIVEAVMPSVVSITSTSSVEGYSIFGQRYEQQISSAGTGFIVGENDDELLFATNNHVVEDATAIQVTFCDEQTAEAIVKGTDAQADLAVVAVRKKDIKKETSEAIKVALLGDSDKVKVGQIAIAIGNAQGMGQSVTVGYISAKDRKLDMGEENTDNSKSMSFLQTDAAINGGNSGGPLIDINGNVVGINSAKISDTSVEGMCYAIPISTAIPIINELMNRETLTDEERGYLGIALQDISAEAVEMYNVPDGVYVAKITANGPAEKAGIKEGDIITEINGVSVNTKSAASDKINSYRAGTDIDIVVYRQSSSGNGYEAVNIKATLGTAKDAGVEIRDESDNENPENNDEEDGGYSDDYYNNEMDDWFNGMFPW